MEEEGILEEGQEIMEEEMISIEDLEIILTEVLGETMEEETILIEGQEEIILEVQIGLGDKVVWGECISFFNLFEPSLVPKERR